MSEWSIKFERRKDKIERQKAAGKNNAVKWLETSSGPNIATRLTERTRWSKFGLDLQHTYGYYQFHKITSSDKIFNLVGLYIDSCTLSTRSDLANFCWFMSYPMVQGSLEAGNRVVGWIPTQLCQIVYFIMLSLLDVATLGMYPARWL